MTNDRALAWHGVPDATETEDDYTRVGVANETLQCFEHAMGGMRLYLSIGIYC